MKPSEIAGCPVDQSGPASCRKSKGLRIPAQRKVSPHLGSGHSCLLSQTSNSVCKYIARFIYLFPPDLSVPELGGVMQRLPNGCRQGLFEIGRLKPTVLYHQPVLWQPAQHG